jgi:hypothetical protein
VHQVVLDFCIIGFAAGDWLDVAFAGVLLRTSTSETHLYPLLRQRLREFDFPFHRMMYEAVYRRYEPRIPLVSTPSGRIDGI